MVGGVIPPGDFDALYAAGAAAIFRPEPSFPTPPWVSCRNSALGSATTCPDAGADKPAADNPGTADLAEAIRGGDRVHLARAITLIESNRPDHRERAQDLLMRLMPDAGSAHHVGLTGVPGWASRPPSMRSACT